MDEEPPAQRRCPEVRVEEYQSVDELSAAVLVNAWTGWHVRMASRGQERLRAEYDR